MDIDSIWPEAMSDFGYSLLVYMGGGKLTEDSTQVKQVSRVEVHTVVDHLRDAAHFDISKIWLVAIHHVLLRLP